jgi:hypothetical protein
MSTIINKNKKEAQKKGGKINKGSCWSDFFHSRDVLILILPEKEE